MSIKDKIANAVFEEVPARNSRPWTRERYVCRTNWTFGVWYDKIGWHEFRGIDLGPVSWTWKRRYDR